MTFFVAGTETVATTLCWALHLIAHNPDIAERLRTEVDTVLGERAAGPEDMPRLKLTRQILTETVRLWPAMLLFTRLVTRDALLGGQDLPAGTVLLSSAAFAHYQGDLHCEPTRFDPDRWDPDSSRPPREGFLPFGTGASASSTGSPKPP
ncbi:cytochrome P450 [Streptomyces varsoviensis]|uniref:cytochrome P450 n=1 Tax=Streptomyces varsoviensis TaxID=67373 RepID=UPI0033D3E34B